MPTQCTPPRLEFQGVGTRQVIAAFDGGPLSSDGGVLLLREVDTRLGLCERVAAAFTDHRDPDLIEHTVLDLVRQRVYGLALGYEDLNDHDEWRHDPLVATAVGKTDPEGRDRKRARDEGCGLAGKSTLNRLELTPEALDPKNRYRKVVHHADKLEDLFVTFFLEGHAKAPEEVILDFDATDDPLHGHQEGRFFHGYYDSYCYLPLYVFCGDHLLVAKLRTADKDGADGAPEVLADLVAKLRARWPETRIVVRADSGFARDALMSACEEREEVYYLLGLAKNARLLRKIGPELVEARAGFERTGQAFRTFAQFHYRTHKSWSRERRVIAKAEWLEKGANPRFVVTNLPEAHGDPRALYEKVYCARGEMENRIKEQQLDLFADRTSTGTLRANQLRLWLASLAYVLVSALRRTALAGTRLGRATCGTIRLKLLKLGARVQVSVRRVVAHLAAACPYQDVFVAAWTALQALPLRC